MCDDWEQMPTKPVALKAPPHLRIPMTDGRIRLAFMAQGRGISRVAQATIAYAQANGLIGQVDRIGCRFPLPKTMAVSLDGTPDELRSFIRWFDNQLPNRGLAKQYQRFLDTREPVNILD